MKVFDNTPAGKDATLEAGDEIVGINGTTVKVRKMLINCDQHYPIPGQDQGGGSKDDPGNEGRSGNQIQQTAC